MNRRLPPGNLVRSCGGTAALIAFGGQMAMKRIGVVGTGLMGAGVAEVAAKTGFEVVVRSRTEAGSEQLLGTLGRSLARQVDKGKLDAAERDDVLGRVRAVTALEELGGCDLVSESIVEDLTAKRELFAELDRVCA
ncbi:MAG: 3-hydroxyacyl-CoA dehydrogenase family protein, partial [Acidimicrobiia bacterium]